MYNSILKASLSALMMFAVFGCQQEPEDGQTVVNALDTYEVYVSSGNAYGGLGITPAAPSHTVSVFDMAGRLKAILRDYTSAVGDSPVSILNYSPSHILVLVENTGGRRIELVAKDGSSYSTFLANSTALNGVLRTMRFFPDGGLLVSKSTAIEFFTMAGTRVQKGANAYVQAPGGSCATSALNITGIATNSEKNIIMAHAFSTASPNNRISIISKSGYGVAGDCLASLAAPTTAHFPTSLVMHTSGNLLVGYGNNTGPIHQIYSIPLTANTFGTPVKAFDDITVSQGISAMAELPDGTVLVASAHANFNTIDRMTLNPTTGALTRIGTGSLIGPNLFTRSVNSIMVLDPAAQ